MNLNQEEKWLLEEKYKGLKNEGFQADLKRLAGGEPLAYIIGHVPFLDCDISLDSKPLIPRPETEFWVEKILPFIRMKGSGVRVLDLCAGSGCIGVSVAKAVPSAHVTFAEIDAHHLPTIEKNLQINISHTSSQNLSIDGKVLEERFEVIESDLFENLHKVSKTSKIDEIRGAGLARIEPYLAYGDESSGTRNKEGRDFGGFGFDFILSNPPYIDPAVDRAEANVKNYEPHQALYGGVHGLELILTIIRDSKNYMNEGGQLWIEHEPEQVAAIYKSAEASGFSATTHQDQYGVSRFSVLVVIPHSSRNNFVRLR